MGGPPIVAMPRQATGSTGRLLRSPAVYEKKVGKAYLRGCLKTLVVAIVGAIFGTAMLLTVLWLIQGGRVEPRTPRFALALAVPMIFMALLMLPAVLWVRIRAARLDRAFEPWRLRGRQAGAVMRSWHGEIDGRAFNAWFHKGPTIELYLGCRPATRAVIHRGGALIRALSRAVESRQPMDPSPIDLSEVSVHADDEDWLRRLLRRPEGRDAVTALLEETPRAAAAISVAPNAVRYLCRYLPLSELDEDNMRRWVGELGALADAVDAVGPSADAREPGRLEEWARTSRDRYLNRILLGLGLFLLLALAALFVFGWFFAGQS